ncbi:ycf3-interacting protein 1, chloroplastic isoform X2 [Syzygium oleosum]|uniref:ycf3-interacting protein 1, chloroplastic isoform X2 n=1 Tax=Syzygium oleosum TaxID=219896 RepID=UPI0024B98A92|nr:ycf3-interacting protein 1, chloroplastic isoform X2 [Syzygium oleosum]
MLSLQPPRCRFSLPIAFSGSGDARSLSWPGPSRRVGCSSAPNRRCGSRGLRRKAARVRSVGKEEAELRTSSVVEEEEEEKRGEYEDVDPQDLEYVRQIRRVLELLKKNRDMIFSEVKLTIMIEDPREVERRRLLGIEDPDAPTRDDLVEALVQVNEGKIPEDRLALKMLAEEMLQWPNLEEAAPKKKPGKSLYAKATDTGISPEVAAKRLNVDWDSAAEIEEADDSDETEVPPAVAKRKPNYKAEQVDSLN